MNKEYIYYINGEWISQFKAAIPLNDAGFLYGDGLFETMRFDNKQIFSPIKHINRLMKSLKIIELEITHPPEEIFKLLNLIIDKNKLKSGIIRLMITRGIPDKNIPGIYITI